MVDSASVRAVGGVPTGPNPTNRDKPDSKHHSQLVPLVDRIPPVAGRVGRSRRRPDRVQGNRAYDSQAHRGALHKRGIAAVLAGADRNGRWHGCINFVGFESVGSDETTSMRRCSTWDVFSSVGISSRKRNRFC